MTPGQDAESVFVGLAFDVASALAGLLDDTQHERHPDCVDGSCPVREAHLALARWREHYPALTDGADT